MLHFTAFKVELWCITILHNHFRLYIIETSKTFLSKYTSNHSMIWCITLINPLKQELCRSAPAVIVNIWQFLNKSTRCLPPPAAVLVGGGCNGRGATRLNVLQVAGVAEKVAVQRVAAMTLLIVQLHLTVLKNTNDENDTSTEWTISCCRSDFCCILTSFPTTEKLDSNNCLTLCTNTIF